jgi:hypothetical protein
MNKEDTLYAILLKETTSNFVFAITVAPLGLSVVKAYSPKYLPANNDII